MKRDEGVSAEDDVTRISCHVYGCPSFAGNVSSLTEQLSSLEASSAELSRNLQELQQEHSKVC